MARANRADGRSSTLLAPGPQALSCCCCLFSRALLPQRARQGCGPRLLRLRRSCASPALQSQGRRPARRARSGSSPARPGGAAGEGSGWNSEGGGARVERGRCSEDGAARAEQRSACGRRLGGEPDLARGDAGGEQLLAGLCPRVDGVAVHQREHARQLLDPLVQVVALARHCGEQEREGDGRVPRLPERLAQLLVLVKDLPTPCRVPDMSTTRPKLERSGLQRGGVVAYYTMINII